MTTEPKSAPKISDALGEFLHDLDGIKSAEQIACPLIQTLAKKASQEYKILVSEFRTETETEVAEITLSVPVDRIGEFKRVQRRGQLTNSAINQTPRALLVAMISSFDAYLARLL